jgi:hypothetical protein
MTSSIAKVTSADARHVPSAEATDVTSAEATDVAAAEVAAAESAHMATTTSVSSATTAAGLCISGHKAAGKHCTRQHHQHSSSHHILLWNGRDFPPQGLVRRWRVRGKVNVNVAMDRRWVSLIVVSTKFPFNHPD